MCLFLSLVSNGRVGTVEGKLFYFDWELRKKCLSGELDYNPDSHTSIADYFGYKGKKEDNLNKYEYNPITKLFVIDQLNTLDDSDAVKEKCTNLDFKLIAPGLIIKETIHPFSNNPPKITKKHKDLLKAWASVRASVGDSVWDSVWASVGDSVWASVGDSVWASVGDSVRASVRASVWDSVGDSVRASVWASVGASVRASVWDSVWDSVGDSVWDSVGAYIGTFFDIKEWKYADNNNDEYPFKPCIELWEMGLVPSFDGSIWRLHGNKNGDILFEITQQELDTIK